MYIKGLDKAAVLAALYNRARVLGMGALHAKKGDMMTLEEARKILANGDSSDYPGHAQTSYFDYLHGRVMKVDLSGDELRTELYNRDNGPLAAEEAIINMR